MLVSGGVHTNGLDCTYISLASLHHLEWTKTRLCGDHKIHRKLPRGTPCRDALLDCKCPKKGHRQRKQRQCRKRGKEKDEKHRSKKDRACGAGNVFVGVEKS
jgi:hypothetical protein